MRGPPSDAGRGDPVGGRPDGFEHGVGPEAEPVTAPTDRAGDAIENGLGTGALAEIAVSAIRELPARGTERIVRFFTRN